MIADSLSSDTPHSRDEYDDQNIERISNQREYQNNCDNQNPPSGLDPCEAAKWKHGACANVYSPRSSE